MNLSPEATARLGGMLATFASTLSGLAFETLPFLLLGALLSSFIQVFIPEQSIRRLFPKNHLLSIVLALFAGLCLPICECAAVPIARRLRKSGLPLSSTVAFLVASPIINPLTIISTIIAFKGTVYDSTIFFRLGIGLSAAFILALLVEAAVKLGRLDPRIFDPSLASLVNSPSFPATTLDMETKIPPKRGMGAKILDALDHASYDFLDMARYLIAGIAVAAGVRALLPAGLLLPAAGSAALGKAAGTGLGMVSAYVLSLCSSADAFVARSAFVGYPYATMLSFLVLGPMIDLKNTILLSRFIGARRAVLLAATVAVLAAFLVLILVSVGVA